MSEQLEPEDNEESDFNDEISDKGSLKFLQTEYGGSIISQQIIDAMSDKRFDDLDPKHKDYYMAYVRE